MVVSQVLYFRAGSWAYPQTQTRLETLARDQHFNLLRKFVNYGQKSFIILAQWPVL
jgi:hypothetical protein